LAFLRREYRVGEAEGETPYVLYGHSCGATLALQTVMGIECGPNKDEVPVPSAIVGLQGIYDLVGLNQRFNGAYREMIAGAFGDDEEAWKQVSPVRFTGKFSETWSESNKGLFMLAYSRADEWIDEAEIDAMEARLKEEQAPPLYFRGRKDLRGGHDDVPEDGLAVGQVLTDTISELLKLSS
jgi:kynurenine formamidase